MPVNYTRLAFAFVGATVAYFASGFAMFAALPGMKAEFLKYPNVFRPEEDMMKVMPYNMVGNLISIAIVAVVYARIYVAGGGLVPGVCVGALAGIFSVCTYVIHNYATLKIGVKLSVYEGVTYFVQWVIVGAAIGLIYKSA
jgi:hypothetical protein